MKKIILCADDYAQNTRISDGIIDLIQKERLSATSCMVNTNDWKTDALKLLPYKKKIDIGLHFNLTEGKSLQTQKTFCSLKKLLTLSLIKKINTAEVEQELHAQLDRFVELIGELPNFIDGHQHIHQFPVIREIILRVYNERLKQNKSYIRLAFEKKIISPPARFKKLIIQLTGAYAFEKSLIKNNIPHNASFSGVYHFQNSTHYPQLFPMFLSHVSSGGLIMCHPGLNDSTPEDPLSSSRYNEYCYFISPVFLEDCSRNQIQLVRYQEI